MSEPSYLKLSRSGELAYRAGFSYSMLRECRLCPRNCGVNRLKDERGFCGTGKIAKVASANLHHGEEPPISGTRGSGTIFFAGCSLCCNFCQNFPLSRMGHGQPSPPRILAEKMLKLQKRGAHNLNLVTPSHVVPQFLAGLCIAAKEGFALPIVYNSSGYEGMEALRLLDGVVDIYMPDIKYATREAAAQWSDAPDYWDRVRPAVKEMYRQVGALKMDEDGIGVRGMLIRHLVLPGLADSPEKVFEFVATELSKEVPMNLMSQYFPADRAIGHPLLGRRITKEEFAEAREALNRWGLDEGWIQEID